MRLAIVVLALCIAAAVVSAVPAAGKSCKADADCKKACPGGGGGQGTCDKAGKVAKCVCKKAGAASTHAHGKSKRTHKAKTTVSTLGESSTPAMGQALPDGQPTPAPAQDQAASAEPLEAASEAPAAEDAPSR